MKFVQVVKFSRESQDAHSVGGERVLVNTSRIAEVTVGRQASEHAGNDVFKWLVLTYFDGEWETVYPFDHRGEPMSPTGAASEEDRALLDWFEWVARV